MMRKLVSPFVLLMALCLFTVKEGWAQNNPPPPDCVIVLNNWTTVQSSSSFANYFTACQTWTFQYTSVGFTGLTITVQSAPAATATTPGAFVTYAGTVSTGINPNTNTVGRITTFSNGLVDIPWIRVNLSGLTGTGTVFGVLYGYKTGYARSGGGGSGTCAPTGIANQILTDTGALGCQSDVATLDSSGNLSTPASLSMVQAANQPIIANSFGFQAPSTYTSALRLVPPNANPTANQFMLFPSPSSNISQWAWTTFVSTNLTDSANLVRNNGVNTGTSTMTLDMSASNSAAAHILPNLAGASSATNGAESYDTTNKNIHAGANGVDNVAGLFPSSALPADQNCIKASVSSSVVRLADAGSPCGGASSGTAGSPLAVQTTSVTVTSNSETSLIGTVVGSKTIPANWFTSAGTVMEVCASGIMTTAAAAQGTVNFKLKFGSTVVAQTGAFTPTASLSNNAYDFCIRLTARTVGGTGTIMATNIFPLVAPGLATPDLTNFTNPTPGTAVVVDTTATQVLDLTVTFSANATNSITQTNFYMVGPGSAVSSVNGLTGAVTVVTPAQASGRLTTESGVCISTADRTAQGTLFFTPCYGATISLYSGTTWASYSFTELSLALTITSGKNYDVFVFNNSGTLTLELSAAWAGDNTRTDALTTQDGIYVKSGATTRRYVGTIRASATNQTSDSGGGTTTQVGGQRYVYNYYNRVDRWLAVFDSTDSWTYATATWRQANAAAGNKVEFVIGQPEDAVVSDLAVYQNGTATASIGAISIGADSITTPSLLKGDHNFNGTGSVGSTISTHYRSTPTTAGYHYFAWLEFASGATITFFGDAGLTYLQSGLTAMIRN